jgi:hypothetical protein
MPQNMALWALRIEQVNDAEHYIHDKWMSEEGWQEW